MSGLKHTAGKSIEVNNPAARAHFTMQIVCIPHQSAYRSFLDLYPSDLGEKSGCLAPEAVNLDHA